MNSSFTPTKSTKHHNHDGVTTTITQVIEHEQAEAIRLATELKTLEDEETSVAQDLAKRLHETEDHLKQSANAELQAFKNGEPSTNLENAKQVAKEHQQAIETAFQKKSEAIVSEMIQSLPSYI